MTMEAISAAILSSFIYDMLKHSVLLTSSNIRTQLKDWVIDEKLSKKIASEISQLNLTNAMSEASIENKLTSSPKLMSILSNIKPKKNTVIQTHSGSGDNIAGNKIIHNK